jgi:hypothetical protein
MNLRTPALVSMLSMVLLACSDSSDSAADYEGLLRYFPPDTSGVVFVDLGALRDNAFIGGMIGDSADVRDSSVLDAFESGTGFDFDRDVRQVMGGSFGEGRALIVASAAYDRERVVSYLTGEGMIEGEEGLTPLFRPDRAREGVVAFIDEVALVGSEPEVRGAIGRAQGGLASALDNDRLLEDIRSIEDGYQVWATGRVDPGLLPSDLGAGGPMDLLRSLERGTYQMRIDQTISARAIGEFTSPGQARTAASLLEGLRGMAMIQSLPGDLAQLLSGILIASSDRRVEIQLDIDTAVLERLAASGALSR